MAGTPAARALPPSCLLPVTASKRTPARPPQEKSPPEKQPRSGGGGQSPPEPRGSCRPAGPHSWLQQRSRHPAGPERTCRSAGPRKSRRGLRQPQQPRGEGWEASTRPGNGAPHLFLLDWCGSGPASLRRARGSRVASQKRRAGTSRSNGPGSLPIRPEARPRPRKTPTRDGGRCWGRWGSVRQGAGSPGE